MGVTGGLAALGCLEKTFEPTAMNVPHLTQNMRLGVLGVSQLQQSMVREGTTGTCGATGWLARSAT